MRIKILKAFNGDSIWLSFSDQKNSPRNVLIDGGVGETYLTSKNRKGKREFGELKKVLDSIRQKHQKIDLLILTHIDDDHIGGILKWFQYDSEAFDLINKVWFNSGGLISETFKLEENRDLELYFDEDLSEKTSIPQGKSFAEYIHEHKIWHRQIIRQGDPFKELGLDFKILSPDNQKLEKLLKEWKKKDPDLKTASKEDDYHLSIREHLDNDNYEEDKAIPNGSSIAFILEWNKLNFLFLGDAHPSVLIAGLQALGFSRTNNIKCELVKLSHHGSAGNTSPELLEYIECNNYIVSTNGNSHQHPHKQMLARLINENKDCTIWFNYKERMDMVFTKKDKSEFPDFKSLEVINDFQF
jgi:beta-lactamase superfamily II metal-dependent hydrolase